MSPWTPLTNFIAAGTYTLTIKHNSAYFPFMGAVSEIYERETNFSKGESSPVFGKCFSRHDLRPVLLCICKF